MSSMGCFCSSFFSISTMSLTPSTTICTCSTSEKPRRSALEMSNTAPTAAVSTPPGQMDRWTEGAAGARGRPRAAPCPGWTGR
uniref:Secreted protein n=1 Tax=Cyanoderma ruficeps TaxID=181631 RepID=A0A8C3QJJ4_9PASS